MKRNKVITLHQVSKHMDPKFTAECNPAVLAFFTTGNNTSFVFECCFNLPLPLSPVLPPLMTLKLQNKKEKEMEVFLFIFQSFQTKLVLLSSAQFENSQEIGQGYSRMQGQQKLILLFETGRKKRVVAPGLRLPAQAPFYFIAESRQLSRNSAL